MMEEVKIKSNRMKTRNNLYYNHFLPSIDAFENLTCPTRTQTFFLADEPIAKRWTSLMRAGFQISTIRIRFEKN
jgi:hypothetical protein